MVQQGQIFELTRRTAGGNRLWAYRYRTGGRDSRRVQRGGFVSEEDAREALERELERIRRERRIARRLTLGELVETYLAQHDVQPVTIEKLRYLLGKATAVFGDRQIGELTSQEIAEWRMSLSPGYRFEATQALRQPYHRSSSSPETLEPPRKTANLSPRPVPKVDELDQEPEIDKDWLRRSGSPGTHSLGDVRHARGSSRDWPSVQPKLIGHDAPVGMELVVPDAR
jgi:hypothetical protein